MPEVLILSMLEVRILNGLGELTNDFWERAESDGYRVNGDFKQTQVELDWIGSESDVKGYLSWSLSSSDFAEI